MGSDIPGLVGTGESSKIAFIQGYLGIGGVPSSTLKLAQKIGLRLPGCSWSAASGGINLNKCCQVSKLNPVQSWAGCCQERPDDPLVRLSLGSRWAWLRDC